MLINISISILSHSMCESYSNTIKETKNALS